MKRSSPPFRSVSGFTLLEMLVVMMIIGLLVSMVGPRLFSKVDSSRVQTAAAQIKLLRGAVETMRLDINTYPTMEQGLRLLVEAPADPTLRQRWKGPYLEENVPLDPWGNPYQYQLVDATTGQTFLIISLGADGKPGGNGNDQDLGYSTLPGANQPGANQPGAIQNQPGAIQPATKPGSQ